MPSINTAMLLIAIEFRLAAQPIDSAWLALTNECGAYLHTICLYKFKVPLATEFAPRFMETIRFALSFVETLADIFGRFYASKSPCGPSRRAFRCASSRSEPAAKRYDVIVVAGGISGALVAHALLRQDRSLLIVDRREPVMRSSVASTAKTQREIAD